jgi:uncharacterized protein (TIGR00251 family)
MAQKSKLIYIESAASMESILLKVYLQPRASKNEVVGPYRDGIKVKVTAPPTEGKANESLIRFLAKKFGISPSCIEIIKGLHAREKTLRISATLLNALPDFNRKTP